MTGRKWRETEKKGKKGRNIQQGPVQRTKVGNYLRKGGRR